MARPATRASGPAWWLNATRWPEWGRSKLSAVVTAYALMMATRHNESPAELLAEFLLLLVFTCLYLALGYMLNDLADWDADIQAGKQRSLHGLGRPAAAMRVSVVAIAAGAVGWWIARSGGVLAAGVVCALLLLAVAYSMPPLRLKTRGVLGLVSAALAQRVLPVCLVIAWSGSLGVGAVLLLGLAFATGIRQILVHQIGDAEADGRTGVRTYATQHGVGQLVELLVRIVAPVELALCLGLVVVIGADNPLVALVLCLYGPIAYLDGMRLTRESIVNSVLMDRSFLVGFEEAWLPIVLSVYAATRAPAAWSIACVTLLLCWRPILQIGYRLLTPSVIFYGVQDGPRQMPLVHAVRHPSYFEWWYVDVRLEDGTVLSGSASIRDGFGSRSVSASVDIRLRRPEGELHVHREDVSVYELGPERVVADGFTIERGPDCQALHLRVDTELGSLDLQMTGILDAAGWAAEGTRFTMGGERVFGWWVAMPRADVVARLPGLAEPIRGVGYHDQNWGSIDLRHNVRRWDWCHLSCLESEAVVVEIDFDYWTRVRSLILWNDDKVNAWGERVVSTGRRWFQAGDDFVRIDVSAAGTTLVGTLRVDKSLVERTRARRVLRFERPRYKRRVVSGGVVTGRASCIRSGDTWKGIHELSEF